jgi:hypothetical protein
MKPESAVNKVFKVKIEFLDGSCDYFHVAAVDDLAARTRAIEFARRSWKDTKSDSEKNAPDVDYCEIQRVCDLD